VKRF